MKTTKLHEGPYTPVERFVQVIWYKAFNEGAKEIILKLDHDKAQILFDQKDVDPPPPNLIPSIIKEFLKYAIRVWPWTRSVKDKVCRIISQDKKIEWVMSSPDLSKELTIKRIYS